VWGCVLRLVGGEWVLNVNYSHQNQLNENNPGRKDIAHDKRDIPPLRALRSEVFNDLPQNIEAGG